MAAGGQPEAQPAGGAANRLRRLQVEDVGAPAGWTAAEVAYLGSAEGACRLPLGSPPLNDNSNSAAAYYP